MKYLLCGKSFITEETRVDLPVLAASPRDTFTDSIGCDPDRRRMTCLACSEDVQDIEEHPHGDSDFQYQFEADQSTVHDEERVVNSGLLMNNVNPEERIVIVGCLDNEEIAEEQQEEVEVAENEGFLAEQIDNTATPPTVWLFYGEAGVLDH